MPIEFMYEMADLGYFVATLNLLEVEFKLLFPARERRHLPISRSNNSTNSSSSFSIKISFPTTPR